MTEAIEVSGSRICETDNHENNVEISIDDENENISIDNNIVDDLKTKIKSLEEILKVQTNDKIKFKEELESLQSLMSHQKAEFRLKVDYLTKAYDDEKHDKESMVLKFAQAEQKNLDMQKKNKELEGRLRECKYNLDCANNEKDKLNKELKSRISDFSTYERELNNLKASLTISEQKIKLEKSRFDEEIERNKESKKRYEEMQRNILVLKEENSTLRTNCQEIVHKYQNSEEMLSNSLSSSLKQVKEELKKCMEDKKEAQESHNKISSELQINKATINSLSQELKNFKEKIKLFEADRMCQEETIKQLKDAIKSLTYVKDQLSERISYLEPFESRVEQITQESDRLIVTNTELRKICDDNECVLGTLRQKESELLEFIQSLSNKNAELQTEKQQSSQEKDGLTNQILKIEQKYKDAVIKINYWENKFKNESKNWTVEREKFMSEIDNLTKEITNSNLKLAESSDQIYSLQKKHKAHIKDLTRQLTKSNISVIGKIVDLKDSIVPSNVEPSKTGYISSTSEESQNSNQNLNEREEGELHDNETIHKHSKLRLSPVINGKNDYLSKSINDSSISPNHSLEIHMIEPHNQALIDKIIRLQQINAKLQEKIEFLSEHTNQLTKDIQKKTVLLRYFFSQNEERGSVKSDSIDDNHLMMVKKGGIMASVFSSRQADENMTLELSLEINRRLQSVLEDTTIKNFTLKDSINTLGEEISRLSSENRDMRKQLTTL